MTANRSGRRACPWSTSIEERDHPPPGRTCGGSSVEPDFANFYLHAMVTTVCRDRDRRDRLRLQPRPKQPAPGLECVERKPDFGPCRRDIEARLVELPRQTRVRRPDMHVIRAIASTHDEAHTGRLHARRSERVRAHLDEAAVVGRADLTGHPGMEDAALLLEGEFPRGDTAHHTVREELTEGRG